MRATNYRNSSAFERFEPQHMVRVALVEGLHPSIDNVERQRYKRLLTEYSHVDEAILNSVFRLLIGTRTPREERYKKRILGELLSQLNYGHGAWKPFDYDKLKQEGVVIPYSGNDSGLVQKINGIDSSKVIFVRDPIWELVDAKHIPEVNKLVLNGPDVVQRFAQVKGFQLPEQYLKSGVVDNETYSLLESRWFTFRAAVETAVNVLKNPEYAKRQIASWAIQRQNGSELRLYVHNFIEAAELFLYLDSNGAKIQEVLGNRAAGGSKYANNVFIVPKRSPREDMPSNRVETVYAARVPFEPANLLEWIAASARCDCEGSTDRRNFYTGVGPARHIVENFDAHIGAVILHLQASNNVDPTTQNSNNMNPLPSAYFADFFDKLRYQVAAEINFRDGGKPSVKRAKIGETGLEILLNELAKQSSFSKLFKPRQKIRKILQKPLYSLPFVHTAPVK